MAFMFELITEYIQGMEDNITFLSKDITDAVRDANFEILEKLSKDEINGYSNAYMGSGRPLIFDALSSYRKLEVFGHDIYTSISLPSLIK